jgi:nicotinamidase-related amidase
MATIRPGTQSALLVVDVQVGVVAEAGDVSQQIGNILLAVSKARDAGVPVIWVQHDDEELPKGSAAWQWVPALLPKPGDVRVYKQFNSSFEQTTLEAELAARSVSHIVLAGAVTSWCIRATAYGALDRGYDLTLLHDAHIAKDMRLEDGTVIEAANTVREFNVVMQWLSYPGRRNRVVTAQTLAFQVSG